MTHQLAARFTARTTVLRDRLEARREAGQNSLEYLGMALVAGIVIAAIVGVVNSGAVGPKITEAWNNIIKAN
ncbi:hypothetical protein [Phycicoccus flavus]|uniref:hypothetical protein n=1 Tax=Phycicoccus flavus TaxID=2502783 RepID=UPI000FEBDEA9|nr:hypothetical protein [Phycicoccus flavus]NHA69456.1 hypothetical protein [Phycicoccus flavus]